MRRDRTDFRPVFSLTKSISSDSLICSSEAAGEDSTLTFKMPRENEIARRVPSFHFSAKKQKLSRVGFKKSTFEIIRRGMRAVVSDAKGTGNVLSTLGVSVAGKTGTAQVSHGSTHAWFVGFFPFDNPKYVICVLLENGGAGHTASVVAGKIIEAMNKQGII